jgi:CelD/BcsL family acetyltransferase involved in cellulose biosynthesis
MRLALDDPRWVEFTRASPEATPFHHPAWAQLLSEAYGFPGFAVAAADDEGNIVAGAPFLAPASPLGVRRWVSLPFTDECTLLASGPAAGPAVVSELERARREGAAPRIELRCAVAGEAWDATAGAVAHVLDLAADPADVSRGFSRSQVLRNIRRADREGVVVGVGTSDAHVEAFYALHLRTRRRQGVPVQPRGFFTLLQRRMLDAGLGEILIASVGDTAIAGAVFLFWNGTTIYKFGASDPEAWGHRPNHALFWTAIQRSCARGDGRFDFGRTDLDNSGLRAFKASWGAVERPLVYSLLPTGARREGDALAARVLAPAIRHGPKWVCRAAGETLYRYAG